MTIFPYRPLSDQKRLKIHGHLGPKEMLKNVVFLNEKIKVYRISIQGGGNLSLNTYEVIEDILPFDLNTERPLSDIWLLSYKHNNFGCFWKKINSVFLKTPI